MAEIGSAIGSNAFKARRMRPSQLNLQDKSTVVSIYGKEINERKSTVFPGHFKIKPGSYENPSLLVIGQSRWWREVDPDQDLFEVPVGSAQLAASLVNDYCNGLVGVSEGARPGLFFLLGDISITELRKNHKDALEKAQVQQTNWYNNLVRMADVDWARTNGNPLSISEDARTAAKYLNLNNKDWMQDFTMLENVKCIACGQPRNPKFPICPSCHMVVDVELYNKMGIGSAIGEQPKMVNGSGLLK